MCGGGGGGGGGACDIITNLSCPSPCLTYCFSVCIGLAVTYDSYIYIIIIGYTLSSSVPDSESVVHSQKPVVSAFW